MREPETNVPEPAVVLFDRDCGFCRWSVAVVTTCDRNGHLRAVEIQSAEGQELLEPVPAKAQLDSFHIAEPGGAVSSAGDAIPPLLRRLPGGRLPARVASRWPGLTGRFYFFIADRRSFFGRILRRLGRIPPGSE